MENIIIIAVLIVALLIGIRSGDAERVLGWL